MILKDPHHLPRKNENVDESWPTSSFFLGSKEIYEVNTSPNVPAVETKERAIVKTVHTDPQPEVWIPPVRMHATESEFEHWVKKWFVKMIFAALILYVFVIISIFLFKLLIVVIAAR